MHFDLWSYIFLYFVHMNWNLNKYTIKHHISPNPHGCNQQLYSFLHSWYIGLMSFLGSLHNNACLCLCQRLRPTFPYFGGAPCLSHAHGGIPCLSHAQGKDLSFLEFTFIIWKQEEHTGPTDVHKSINFPYFFFFSQEHVLVSIYHSSHPYSPRHSCLCPSYMHQHKCY